MVMAFGGLSRAVRANYAMIQSAVARGVTSKALNSQLLAQTGKGIRRADLLEGMRFAGGVQQAGRNIGNIPFKNRPNYSTLPQFNRITSDKKYLVQYEIRWKDSQTGETGSNFITIGTDETLTRGELDAEAQAAWDRGRQRARYGEHREIEQIVPMGARQQI